MDRGLTTTGGAMPLVDGDGVVQVARGDDLFGYVATQCGLPIVVGVLFLLGLVASTYSAAGSALTALTTSFTLDILGGGKRDDATVGRMRRLSHIAIAAVMALIIILFYEFSAGGVITLIFTMASYTYGPLLGMFLFSMLCRRRVNERAVPLIAVVSPLICYIVASHSDVWLSGYEFSYEIIVLNAALTMLAMYLFSERGDKN
jgi:Na+/proline symporter